MPTTSPDSIFYPDGSYTSGFKAAMAAAATSIQAALGMRALRTYRWANAAARTAQAGMQANDRGFQVDTGVDYRYNGSSWKEWESDWITWTTAPTNLTVGSGGTILQRYKWIGGRLAFHYSYTLGSSGFTMGTGPTINFPINLSVLVTGGSLSTGDGAIRDVSVPSTPAFTRVNIATATTGVIQTYNGSVASITSTVPMTWAAGDILTGLFWADPA